ncbi:MAG: hypothetical protein RLZZ15_3981 [Verrucomicrobiota bacterium]|jgi:formylglycine-generating enzyme required for sulfatase activity
MHGNVQEWCSDWYAGYLGGAVSDPAGPVTGQFRVQRGGHWGAPAGYARSANRAWIQPGAGNPTIGFRLALAPER